MREDLRVETTPPLVRGATHALGPRVVPAVRALPAVARTRRRRRARDARGRPRLKMVPPRRPGHRAGGLRRRPPRERVAVAGAARSGTYRGRPELRAPGRAAGQRRGAGAKPAARPAGVPTLRGGAVAGRVHP